MFINNFFKGMLIGAGAIAPGISGGVIAVLLGLYDKITCFIANITKDFKKNILFLLPVALGGVAGILIFSRIIEFLYLNYETDMRYAFTGLMLGTISSVINEANKKGYRNKYLIPFFVSLFLTLIITVYENNYADLLKITDTTPVHVIIYGVIIGFGTIVPGISTSVILMFVGAYEIVIGAISNIQIYILFFLGIGFLLSIILFAKIIDILFKKAYGYTYYAIIGLVLGSIISIFPGFEISFVYSLRLILLVLCFFLSHSLKYISLKK